MYKPVLLGMLVRVKPIEATHEILTVLSDSGGNVRRAATAIGVGFRSLYRWIEALGIEGQVEAIQRVEDERLGVIRKAEAKRKRSIQKAIRKAGRRAPTLAKKRGVRAS